MSAVFSGVELTGFICLFVFYSIYLVWFVRSNFCQKIDDNNFVPLADDIETGRDSKLYQSTESIKDDDNY